MSFNIIITVWFVLLLLIIGIKAGSNIRNIYKKEKKDPFKGTYYPKPRCPICGDKLDIDNICHVCKKQIY